MAHWGAPSRKFLSEPLSGPLSVKLPCKPVLLLGLPDWAIEELSHILINDLVYASTSRYGGEEGEEAKLKALSLLTGKELLKLTREQGGTVILPLDDVLERDTEEVDMERLRQHDGREYQAIVVDDACMLREPSIFSFVERHFQRGASIVVMAIEGIFDISSLRSAFDVDWEFVAYTKRVIQLTGVGKKIIGLEAFPFEPSYVKANFIVGEQQLFSEYVNPEDYGDSDEECPPEPEPGSPVVTMIKGGKSISYFGFVSSFSVSYGAIILKLCYAAQNSRKSTTRQVDEAYLYFDGACKRNPNGAAGCGWVLKYKNGEKIAEGRRYLGSHGYTSNVAEYFGLIDGLKHMRQNNISIQMLHVRGDSELVVRHVDGTYRVKSGRLRPLQNRAKQMLGHFKHTIEHIGREDNKEADTLANDAIKFKDDSSA